MELSRLNSAVVGVHTWQVNFRLEADLGGLHGVVWTASDGQEENTIVEFGIGWSNNCAIPLSEGSVITYAHQSILTLLTLAKTIRN